MAGSNTDLNGCCEVCFWDIKNRDMVLVPCHGSIRGPQSCEEIGLRFIVYFTTYFLPFTI